MKLSQTTIVILKNFSMFNPHIVIEAGNKIRTVNPRGTVALEAIIEDQFPCEVALHDLPAFLKIVNLFDDPDFDFGEQSVIISDDSGASQEYYYSEKDDLDYEKQQLPDFNYVHQLHMPDETLKKVLKGAAANGVEDIAFIADADGVSLVALDKENPKRVFKVAIEGSQAGSYKAYMKHSKKGTRLILLPLDYTVKICESPMVIEFSAAEADVSYRVVLALEVDSKF